jgi:hypothetical protein
MPVFSPLALPFSDLLIEGNGETYEMPLAKAHRPALTRRLYEGGFVNYDKGWFCTHQHKGLDLSHLPVGRYALSMRIACHGFIRTTALRALPQLGATGHADGHQLELIQEEGRMWLIKVAQSDS